MSLGCAIIPTVYADVLGGAWRRLKGDVFGRDYGLCFGLVVGRLE